MVSRHGVGSKMTQNQGFTVWFTGMACTGKSTFANYVAARKGPNGGHAQIFGVKAGGGESWGGGGGGGHKRSPHRRCPQAWLCRQPAVPQWDGGIGCCHQSVQGVPRRKPPDDRQIRGSLRRLSHREAD